MELKITKERVLAAAKECSNAGQVLKKLFPEVFEDDIPKIDWGKLTTSLYDNVVCIGNHFVEERFRMNCIIMGKDFEMVEIPEEWRKYPKEMTGYYVRKKS
jgi:hypothetical protein